MDLIKRSDAENALVNLPADCIHEIRNGVSSFISVRRLSSILDSINTIPAAEGNRILRDKIAEQANEICDKDSRIAELEAQLARYKIVGEMVELNDGMGTVYFAEHKYFKRKAGAKLFALKDEK